MAPRPLQGQRPAARPVGASGQPPAAAGAGVQPAQPRPGAARLGPGNIAAGAAAWTADWIRRLADVAVEQGSLSAARHDQLCRRADACAATYTNPLNQYDPDDWTPHGWARSTTLS